MFVDPQHLISQFDLQSGSRVADLGAGSGTFSLLAARAVGEAGKVYAVEVQKELLVRLKNEARAVRLHNLEVIWGDVERENGTSLKEGTIDACIASNLLFQIENREGFVRETKRILRAGGRVLFVESSLRVPEADARALFEGQGFLFIRKIEVGANHYAFIFKRGG